MYLRHKTGSGAEYLTLDKSDSIEFLVGTIQANEGAVFQKILLEHAKYKVALEKIAALRETSIAVPLWRDMEQIALETLFSGECSELEAEANGNTP